MSPAEINDMRTKKNNMKISYALIAAIALAILGNVSAADTDGKEVGRAAYNGTTNLANVCVGSIDETATESRVASNQSSNPILHALLTPVGEAGVFLINKISDFNSFTRQKAAAMSGADIDGKLFLVLFVVGWTVVLALLWFGVKRIHTMAYDYLRGWKWVRFLSIASGTSCVFLHLIGPNGHPDDYWQAVSIPISGLLISIVVSFLYSIMASRGRITVALKTMVLVLVDFMLGFIIAGLIKVIFMAILIAIAAVICVAMAGLSGNSSSGAKTKTCTSPTSPTKPVANPSKPVSQNREEAHTYYAEWSGKKVTIRDECKRVVRILRARDIVVGVQVSGTNLDNGRVAIAMANGKTDLYQANGTVLRRG